ncbi:uncharacterized protein SCO4629-like [Saccostrea echinata]|uniref:uncharacterized protein SCO4629-like n=1 Tax=Saccostrea echinata TaxID=191078 RepID=UPI002A838414|nr:uncharacterized protein SCO4629-like [Saccostrea echinata]
MEGLTLIFQSDVILVLGNHDLRTVEHAAMLWRQGMAPWILFSGKEGANTRGKWKKSEAEIFKDRAISLGVNKNKILLEPKATNTGENVSFSYNILKQRNLLPKKKDTFGADAIHGKKSLCHIHETMARLQRNS